MDARTEAPDDEPFRCPECDVVLEEVIGEYDNGKTFIGLSCPEGCNIANHFL